MFRSVMVNRNFVFQYDILVFVQGNTSQTKMCTEREREREARKHKHTSIYTKFAVGIKLFVSLVLQMCHLSLLWGFFFCFVEQITHVTEWK